MILSVFFAAAALVHAGLLVLTCRGSNGLADWIVRALLLGLLYDNTVLALSDVAMDKSWYYGASWFRYVAHVLILPPLVVAALQIGSRAGIPWSSSRAASMIGLVYVVAACAFGFVAEIAGLELVRETLGEHIRYVSADATSPFATVATSVLVLIFSALLWKETRWPWLFAAALLIFLVNGSLAANPWGVVAGNMAEVVFSLAWVLTLMRFKATQIEI
jgi:hypothetical protein